MVKHLAPAETCGGFPRLGCILQALRYDFVEGELLHFARAGHGVVPGLLSFGIEASRYSHSSAP